MVFETKKFTIVRGKNTVLLVNVPKEKQPKGTEQEEKQPAANADKKSQ